MNRLIFNHSSWRDGVSAVSGPSWELLVAGVPLMRGSAPGVVVRVGVGEGWGDGGRSGRGAVCGSLDGRGLPRGPVPPRFGILPSSTIL